MGIPFTLPMGFLFTVTMGILLTIGLGIQLTISSEMIKAPIDLQELRRRIYRKAKSERKHRFWGIFVHLTKIEVLAEA
jgi:hypothetical protein